MYGYMRGDKYSDDYEQGQFIAALAHKSLHRIGSQELDEEQLDELKCWPGYTRVKGVPAGAPGSCKKKIKEDVSKSDEFIWTDYEGVPIETRMIIAEAHFTNKNLFESNDSESSEYFLSLQSMSSPLKENNQYIISVLALINNNVVQLQPPEIITLLQKKSDSYLVRRNNGQKTEFPAKHLREEMVACSFFFNNSKAYDKFRNIMSLKYDLNLPNINLQGLSEHMNKRVCPHCSGPLVEFSQLNEKKDACYYKVKSRYKVWPSAYASGALVKCRKVGAKNWGNKSKTNESNDRERLWILYADDTAVAKYVSEKEAQRALLDLQDKYSSVKFKIVHQSEKDAIATNTKKMGDKHAKG
jgi:hypothetical protein